MLKFLKNFGLGLLYILLFPFLLVGVVIYAVIGFIASLIQMFLIIIRFFKGEKIFPPYPEDVKAQEILAKNYGLEAKEPAPAPQPAPNNVYVQQNYYQNPQPMNQNPGFAQPQYQQMPPYGYQQMPQQGQNPYLGQDNAPQQLSQEENPYRTSLNMRAMSQNAPQPEPALLDEPEDGDPFSSEEYKGGNDDE